MNNVRFSGRSATLLQLAKEEFGKSWNPTQAEQKLLAAVTTDSPAFCGPSSRDDDESNNPEHAGTWSDKRSVHAKVIRWLCVNRRARDLVDPRGIQIHGAKIIGGLNLRDLVVPFPLELEHCAVLGESILYSLEVSSLSLQGSWVGRLNANGIRVKGDVALRNGFRADGEVGLMDAHIGGQLDCSRGQFINPSKEGIEDSGIALNADGISVAGSVYLRGKSPDDNPSTKEWFRVEGCVRFLRAQLGENLECTYGDFINPPRKGHQASGVALFADVISIKGSIFLRARFTGEVRLLDARIETTLECQHGVFINPKQTGSDKNEIENSGDALSLHRSAIGGDVFLTDGFRAQGSVTLSRAHIEGHLYCTEGDFKDADLWLDYATAKFFGDDGSSRPRKDHLHLNGFVYQVIYPLDASERLKWLQLQPESPFYSQPYLQLAKALAEADNEEGRVKILVAMKDRDWSVNRRGLMSQLGRWPFKIAVGYGYRPLMAIWELMALSGLGWIVYRRSYLAGGIVPTDKDACTGFRKAERKIPAQYPSFSPLIYSVENSLPLVKLGQGDKWQPDPEPKHPAVHQLPPALGHRGTWAQRSEGLNKPITEADSNFIVSATDQTILSVPVVATISTGSGTAATGPAVAPEKKERPPALENMDKLSLLRHFGTSPRFVKWFLWIQILLGWLLATLFVAGVSGIVHKE